MPINRSRFSIFWFSFILFWNYSYAQSGVWTWMHGNMNPFGIYGTQGLFSPTNEPPSTYEACEWVDNQGNFWMFGGSTGSSAKNTLWKYDVSINQWAWITGTSTPYGAPVYGTMGVPSNNNRPGARQFGGMSWTDLNGNLWLFGGQSYDQNMISHMSNELWMFNPATTEWTWVRGYTTNTLSLGNYGVQGVPSPLNEPPGRCECACSWVDSQGDLWMYGGINGNIQYLGDLWRYNIQTNMWTFMSGSSATGGAAVYGTIGVESASNTPGSRAVYARGVENGNYLYLFGGFLQSGGLDDLWRYNLSTGMWTCLIANTWNGEFGPYPDECEYIDGSKPDHGGEVRTCWSDSCGIWIFGGNNTNVLWYYVFGSDGFALMSGNVPFSYGTMGVSSLSNMPPDRSGGNAWMDANGDLWMFGGASMTGSGNDLWKFTVDSSCHCSVEESVEPATPQPNDTLVLSPNIFTPNGDGINDIFIPGNFKDGHRIIIYNRWGQVIFESDRSNYQWDGTYRGAQCSDGVYYYLHYGDVGSAVEKGFLQLIR